MKLQHSSKDNKMASPQFIFQEHYLQVVDNMSGTKIWFYQTSW